jgi:ATP-binding cassette subfamily C protein CydC
LIKLALPLKKGMALAAFIGVLTVTSGIGLMATSAWLISMAALHPSVAALGVAIVGVRFFGLARGVFRYLERYTSHKVTFQLLARLRVWFYQAVEPLAPARLMQHRSGDLLSRIVGDIETLQNFYLKVIAPPVVAAVVGLGMWFLLGAYDLIFAFTFLGFYLVGGVGVPLLTHLLSRQTGQAVIAVRAELNVQILDGLQGMADLLAFGQEDRHEARVQSLNRRLLGLQRRLAWLNGMQTGLANLLMNLAAWTMLVVAIPMVQSGKLDGLYLALVVLAALAAFEAVLPLPLAFQQLGSSLEAARRLFEIADATPAVNPAAGAQPVPQDYSLSIQNLTFRYNPQEAPALNSVSFEVKPGQTLAIVGPSGAGKSSLVNVLLRFWDYQQGEVKLGGYSLREYAPEEVGKLVGVVAQNTHLFNTTIRENLLMARPGATQGELEEATRQARIHDFIQGLPQGYNTRVGEMGLNLSGGERQRLAIARALLKNAPILVLDEATANLDTTAEHEVLAAIQHLMQGRTTIIITHRLAGLERANEILVLCEGRVVERGSQAELLQQEGLFWQMWETQPQAQELLAK